MNIKSIISGNPTFTKTVPEGKPFLNVAEFFYDTIQGENFVGYPAAFLRLQGCTQSCTWCDTKEVWRFGNPYTFDELFDLIDETHLVGKFLMGQHLVLTGGSPLKQQENLTKFIETFVERYEFLPFIEIENECTLMPNDRLINYVSCWNNSPKLSHSGNSDKSRYHPDVLKILSTFDNSWFKFVVSSDEDWKEIERDFIAPGYIRRDQIVLMPLGATRAELFENREYVAEMAVRESVRYSTREHVVLWDKKTGV